MAIIEDPGVWAAMAEHEAMMRRGRAFSQASLDRAIAAMQADRAVDRQRGHLIFGTSAMIMKRQAGLEKLILEPPGRR